MLDQELKLVTQETSKEVDALRKDREVLKGNLIGVKGEQESLMLNEKSNMHKVTQLLEASKKELEVASNQIGQLKQELQI